MINKPLLLIIIFTAFFPLSNRVFAQKGEYIVFQDSVLSQGFVQFPGNEGITSVNFKSGKKKEFITYSIRDISEFSKGGNTFFRRNIGGVNSDSWEFLELLPNKNSGIDLWLSHEKPFRYFIEKDSVLKEFEDGYKDLLKEWLDDPNVEVLIDRTKVNEFELLYLLKTANEIQKPRTFTNVFVFTPYIGFASIWHKYFFPSTNIIKYQQSLSPTFGFNAEAFLNHKRNISFNAGIQTLSFSSQDFESVDSRGITLESDIFVQFSGFQYPIFGKIYLDNIPGKMRLYSELGAIFSSFEIENATVFEAIINGEMVNPQKKEFDFPERHSGILFGFGFERYFNGHRGIVLGIRGSKVRQGENLGLNQIQLHSGFKF
ncbi:hypothetical protein [Aquiflexum sp.]|uniref:hypothetical protein n=1 Tax=Aquiflexum sp. TaxID=1872584 RepID=UPI0035941A59